MSSISKFDFVDSIFAEFNSYSTKSIYTVISREEIDGHKRINPYFNCPALYEKFGSRSLDYLNGLDRLTTLRKVCIPSRTVVKSDRLANVSSAISCVKLGSGECQELDNYFFARFLTSFTGCIASFNSENSRKTEKNHQFSVIIDLEDKYKLQTLGEAIVKKDGFMGLEELSTLLPEAILVDGLHQERCYLKDVKTQAVKTFQYMINHGINRLVAIYSRSTDDKSAVDEHLHAFTISKCMQAIFKNIMIPTSIQTRELSALYLSEAEIIKLKIRSDFPEVIFKDSGPLLLTTLSKESSIEICFELERQNIEFYAEEKPEGLVFLLINCHVEK